MDQDPAGDRHHLWAVANLLVGRYGADAGQRALRNAEDAERSGDTSARALWADVRSLLSGGDRPQGPPS